LSDFKGNLIFGQIFEKSSHVKFHKNASSGRQVVPCGQIDGSKDGLLDGQTIWDGTNTSFLQCCEYA